MPDSRYYYYDKCECGKRKCTKSLRCKSCANLRSNRKLSTLRKIKKALSGRKHSWKPFEGKHHTTSAKRRIGLANTGKIPSLISRKRISRGLKRAYKLNDSRRNRKNEIVKHHIDLKENSDRIIKLTHSKHVQLHQRAYDYLVEKRMIMDYTKWFDKKYGLE